jgi:hypothetical protein
MTARVWLNVNFRKAGPIRRAWNRCTPTRGSKATVKEIEELCRGGEVNIAVTKGHLAVSLGRPPAVLEFDMQYYPPPRSAGNYNFLPLQSPKGEISSVPGGGIPYFLTPDRRINYIPGGGIPLFLTAASKHYNGCLMRNGILQVKFRKRTSGREIKKILDLLSDRGIESAAKKIYGGGGRLEMRGGDSDMYMGYDNYVGFEAYEQLSAFASDEQFVWFVSDSPHTHRDAKTIFQILTDMTLKGRHRWVYFYVSGLGREQKNVLREFWLKDPHSLNVELSETLARDVFTDPEFRTAMVNADLIRSSWLLLWFSECHLLEPRKVAEIICAHLPWVPEQYHYEYYSEQPQDLGRECSWGEYPVRTTGEARHWEEKIVDSPAGIDLARIARIINIHPKESRRKIVDAIGEIQPSLAAQILASQTQGSCLFDL